MAKLPRPILNITINETCNGWIIFVTPKYLKYAGDRTFVCCGTEQLADVVSAVAENRYPPMFDDYPEHQLEGKQMKWPVPENGK